MKIYANEALLMQQNKYRKIEDGPEKALVSEPTATSEETMNALELQGRNNLAFQGVEKSILEKGMKSFNRATLTRVLAALLSIGAVSLSTQSCINVEQVNYDDDMTAIWSAIAEDIEAIKNNTAGTNDRLDQLNSLQYQYFLEWQNHMISEEEFWKKSYEAYARDEELQQQIIDNQKKNGKTEEEIRDILRDIDKRLENHEINAKQAYDEFMALLKNIDSNVEAIKGIVENLWKDFNAYAEKDLALDTEALNHLYNIYVNSEKNADDIEGLAESLSKIAENTTNQNLLTEKLIVLVDEKHDDIIEILKQGYGVDYDKLASLLEAHGISVKEALEMSKKDLIGVIVQGQNQAHADSEAEQALLEEIAGNTEVLQNFGGIDQDAIIKAIEGVQNSINKNGELTKEDLASIKGAIIDAISVLKDFYADFGKFASNAQTYFDLGSDYIVKAVDLLSAQHKDIAAIRKAQENALDYHYLTLKEIQGLKDIVEKALGQDNDMPLDDWKEFMKERDEANYKKLVALMKDLGLLELAGDVNSIRQTLEAMDCELIQSLQDYAEKLDEIIENQEAQGKDVAELKGIAQEINDKIDDIECNCDCGGNGNHEGILGDKLG